ncbi:RagB/SusD family nutrient uptake outer membrane protein [Galbibacter mesophilus]|uniref:RagB/SusD family nutrient uptake outer membrane protein n=1 Tax=Galbibacter mesophilus TaxID=379069 RepID=UPI00293D7C41|nr:RagB/SusD family nutrient uptake outer membrane protein [Galbibacter mesophilus]
MIIYIHTLKKERSEKDQFVDAYGDGVLYPIGKFYAPGREIEGKRNIETDYVYMRIAEIYLLNAEAAARTGDEASAIASLKTLLDKRMDDTSYIDALSGNALLNET